ncbi:MAG TPA: TrbG/VirB9 family P-type conjugative transfer protein [Anaeromyxobacteraceae bacterium]|nr:TrbG/VirB9 family P-type conjugative transfer protein [Anaeromyxobacteraceae bacterium]
MRALLCAVALLAAPRLDKPDEPGRDRRIRYLVYDAEGVVAIVGVIGIATHIVLEPGEKYLTHAFGDGKAWDLRTKDHHLFVKPVATQADSNLTVVTDRRSYHFELRLETDPKAVPTFEVVFEYPESKARLSRERAAQRAVEEGLAKRSHAVNLEYTMSGDLDLAPANAWDDREFTYFKFPGNRDIPAIYLVDAEGAESIVDRHTTGSANDIVAVHRVAPRWVLRLGTRALAIWNGAFDATGRHNATGTISPDVKRVLWR